MSQHPAYGLSRIVTSLPSRRDVWRSLAGAGMALAALRVFDAAEARKKGKGKKKAKLKRNEFGCVDVGGKCRGNNGNCCSGICEGKKPKKGKKDKSVCVAHDTAGICFPDSDSCIIGQQVPCHPDNTNCACFLTTGSAGFCGDGSATDPADFCRDCVRDTDCEAEFGLGAACVVLGGICSTACPETQRRACVPACRAAAP